MIEADGFGPTGVAMTGLAALAELRLVYVVAPVTAVAA